MNKQRDKVIDQMLGSLISNYIIPGLDSELFERGKVRLFTSSRDRAGTVTPHSHRFDFTCYVLEGHVSNRLYTPVSPFGDGAPGKKLPGDTFTLRTLAYDGVMGEYGGKVVPDITANYESKTYGYNTGDWYSMTHKEIHSIMFGKDTRVLFFEGPEKTNYNNVLLPRVNNKTLETMRTENWMFEGR